MPPFLEDQARDRRSAAAALACYQNHEGAALGSSCSDCAVVYCACTATRPHWWHVVATAVSKCLTILHRMQMRAPNSIRSCSVPWGWRMPHRMPHLCFVLRHAAQWQLQMLHTMLQHAGWDVRARTAEQSLNRWLWTALQQTTNPMSAAARPSCVRAGRGAAVLLCCVSRQH